MTAIHPESPGYADALRWRSQARNHLFQVKLYLISFHLIANPRRWDALRKAMNHFVLMNQAELMAQRAVEGGAR
jgi:hypothetical protein